MNKVYLGFKTFDCHELLCHAVAQSAGLYTDRGLSVELLDTTFVPDEALPENTFHTACGAALMSFLAGKKRKVVFVACDRPMFWLYGAADIATVHDLGQARVASFPDRATPAQFLRRLLSDEGASCGLLPSLDDESRLGLLASGSVQAAMLSSRYLPHDMESRGLTTLAFIGDKLRLPSSGLAVPNEFFERAPQLIATMVEVFQAAMNLIFDDDELPGRLLHKTFAMPEQGLAQALETVRECYNPFGFSCETLLQGAVDTTADSMGLNGRAATDLYQFKFVKSHH